MTKVFTSLTMLLFTFMLSAQNCECESVIKDIIEKTEAEYALFSYKITKDNQKLYDTLKKTILSQAESQDFAECQKLANAYIAFFTDGHLWVNLISENEGASSQYEEFTELDSLQLLDLLNKDKKLDPIEGVWETSSYTIAIVKNQNKSRKRDFVGIIINSQNPDFAVGEVKMEVSKQNENYISNYLMGNHDVKELETKIINKCHLKLGKNINWRKLHPIPEGEKVAELWEIDPSSIHFKDYGSGNYYLKIGSFGWNNIQTVKDIVEQNKEKLQTANTLIIDVRDNGGGSDYTYFPLLPYISTGKVELPVGAIWLSPVNRKFFSDWLTKEDTLQNTRFFQAMQSQESQYFSWDDFEEEEESDDAEETLFENPKKIAILANENSGSSAETFILRCIQSKKVITFGQNTAGVVDGFNGNDIETDCYVLRYPTTVRSKNLKEDAIDPFGIYPDVYLSKDMPKSIEFIFNYMDQY